MSGSLFTSIVNKLWSFLQKDYIEVGTPVSNKYYLGAPSGEMYGLDQGLNRFSPEAIATLRSDTDIPGLYLTGILFPQLICYRADVVLIRNLWFWSAVMLHTHT